jgi:hypothetical protein
MAYVIFPSREEGDSGDVFGLLYNANDRNNFALSPIAVGGGIIIINPQLEGEWAGMRMVWSPEPCLPTPVNWQSFVPNPFPDTVS